MQLSRQEDTNEADLTRTGRADLTKSTITRERATLGERNKKIKTHGITDKGGWGGEG